MAFPFPFSILAIVILIGLLVARSIRNQTEFLASLTAFVDIILKLNWFFLIIYLFIGSYNISAIIISSCLFGSIILNFFFWRSAFLNNDL